MILSSRFRIFLRPLLLCLPMIATVLSVPGCVAEQPPNMDWASPGLSASDAAAGEIQDAFDAYARALVAKDRDSFMSVIDPAAATFREQQAELFDRLLEVPFSSYEIDITSYSETTAGRVVAKVESSYTYTGSFPGSPDPERSAYSLAKSAEGWKISSDATAEELGKPRDQGLEDTGPVKALISDRVIVLYHPSEQGTAEEVARLTEAAFPRLQSAVPGVQLPKVPIRVFDNKEQVDMAFPGKWTEWTGGAARQLGSGADQGGEIIIEAGTFREVAGYDPAYNPKMLAHELTHIVLFPMSGSRTPPFLIEGLADFVAGEEEATLLNEKMRRGEPISPTLRDLYQPGGFAALLTTEAATLAYEQSDTAVVLLESRYGNDKVLELIREFKRRGADQGNQDLLVDDVFRAVLGIGWSDFEEQWRRFVVEG